MQDGFPFLSRLKIDPHWREFTERARVFSLPLPMKHHRFIDSSLTKTDLTGASGMTG
jgi:hypothetical protein